MQLAVGLAGGMGEVGGINGIMMSASKFGQASPTAKPTIDSLPDKVGNFGVSIHAAHACMLPVEVNERCMRQHDIGHSHTRYYSRY
jgi:hypothetical protein